MANLLINTTVGGNAVITTSNIGTYAITSIPTSFSSITVTSSFDTASNDIYASMRVIRNNNSASNVDGMYIGYGNSGSGITRIFGGGATSGALEKYATYTVEPGSFRAPIFYDSADTTYYLDPNSTTSLRTVGSWRSDSSSWDGEYSGKIQYHSNHWYFQSGNLWIFRNAGGSNVFQVDQSGNGTFNGDIYLGTRATWLSSYLNQDVRTSASPSFSTVNLNTLNASDTNARYYYQSTNGVPSNNLGNPTVTEMALFDEQFNNKTAFYDNTALSFWTSSDGTNYTEYTGFDTTTKKRFLGGDSDSGVYIPNLTNRFRIEVENTQGYVFLNQLYIYWSSNSHSTKVHIWVRRCDNNQWYQHTDSNTQVSSWPGHLYLPFSGIPFYPGALASNGHFNRIRIEFIPSWSSGTYSYTNINLMRMQIWGGYPAGKRNIYSVDENQNVSFPAILSATTFSGALSGNATTASALTSMNISQFTNNSGYITGYTETDTLNSVTSRGNTTSNSVRFGTHVDLSPTGSAFRFYDGTTFRGGFGLDSWGHSGSDANLVLYVNGDNTLFFSTAGTKRASLSSSAFNSLVALQQSGNQVLHAGNYTSYSPSLTGTGASGTWSIDVTGNAGSAGGLVVHNNRNNEANKIVRTDANGYIQAGWINTTSGAFSSTINKIYCSDDDYMRYQTPANFISNLGLITTSNIGSQSVSYATTAGSLTSMNISQFTNNSGYITGISFANVSSKPTTVAGYGITDAITTANIGSQSVSYATTAGSAPNAGNVNQFYNVTAGLGNGLRFWGAADYYKISMGVGALYQYGPVTDYSIKTQMNDGDATRGFTWGRESHAPIAALNSTSGDMQIAGSLRAAGHLFTSYNGSNILLRSADNTSDAGILVQNSGGTFKFQIYGNGGDYGFLNGNWAGWDIRKTISGAMYMNGDSTYYLQTNSTSNFYALNIQGNAVVHAGNIGSQSVSNASTVGGYTAVQLYTTNSSYLGGYYVSGGTELPNSATFGAGKLKLAMLSGGNLGFGGSWNDVLWLSAYTGGDVKSSHALVFDKYSTNVWVSDQNFDSGSWGTGYLLLSTANYTSYAPSLTGSGASGSWGISVTGSAGSVAWTNVSSRPTALSQFTNDLGNYGGFLTSITAHSHAISDVTGLQTALDSKQASLGFTPYNSTNPSGYITSSGSISGNAATATTASNLAADTSTRFKVITFTGEGYDSGNGNAGSNYGIYQQGGSWTHPYPDLCIGFHTGIKIGAQSQYSGIRFYNTETWGTEIFSVGNGDNHVRVLNNLYVTGTVTGSNLSGTNTGDQTNISGNAATATNVAWTGVTSRPTALSQFSNDLGNYGGWLTTGGKAADSELLDGIDSFRIVYGDGDKKSTNFSDMNAYNQYSGFFFYNQPTGNPFSDWTNWINVMGNSWNNNYGFQIAHAFHSDGFAVRRVTNGSFASWRTIIDSGNIGSQSVSYASSAGSVAWTNVSSRPTALSQFSNDLGNYGGWITSSGSISGSAGSVSGLTLTSSANGINPDSVTQNQIGYNTSVSLFGQTDGGLYSSAYSSSWIHQIYGDFRTGQIAIRGKNSGSWQAWRTVLDSSNYTSYAPGLTGSGASGTWGINVTGSAGSISGFNNPATGATANTIVYRDSSGDIYGRYIFGSYHNSSDNVDTGSITYIMAKFGDNYHRSATAAKVQAFLGLGSLAYSSATIPTNNNQLTNGAGYITGINSGNVTTALGFTPYNATNPSGYITSSASISGNAATATYATTAGSAPANGGNSATVGGYTPSGSVGANTVVIRDANNYIYAHYINSNVSETENPTINSFYTSNGDGWLRKSSVAHVKSQLGLGSMAYESSGTYQTVSGAINTGNIASQSVSYATISQQLTKFGDIYGQDWNSYFITGKLIVSNALGHTGTNRPSDSYGYGTVLSYGETGGPLMQMYFPEDVGNTGGAYRALAYRSGYNGGWSPWKTVVNQVGNTCTVAGSNGTGLQVHSNVGYNQNPLTYFLLRGQADSSWKTFKILLTGDAGGQDIEFRRIAENNTDARMFYVPRGLNQVIFDYTVVQPSDSRLKDNLTPITNPVDKIKSLRGVEFDWNSGEHVGTHDVGLIAQDVEAVLPEAVTTQEDGYKNLAYTKVIPLLVEAMKEQQTMIEALRAEIELLKNK